MCQIISGHFVGWHPQFCSTVNAQVWNWVCNHILLVYHPWHHTNWAIEILIAFDHIDDSHSIVEWALRVTFKSLAFLFTGEKGENVLQKLEQKSIWNNFQEPSCRRKPAGPLWHRSSHVHSWPGSHYFHKLCPMLHCPQNND